LIIVTFPALMRLKLAVPFKATSMHSCEAVVYMIVYSNGLQCTIFTIFYFKSCHTVELSFGDSNLIANG
jgi:hypothetical protein